MRKVCNKCGYERQETDSAPDYECPKCGAVYAKVEAQLKFEAEELLCQKKRGEKDRQEELVRRKEQEEREHQEAKSKKAKQKKIITKTYTGNQAQATAAFQADSTKMTDQGYYPTSQTWVPGSYGCGAFLLALLLCFILIGFIVFVFMLIVKPDGTLSVTYELRSNLTDNTVTDEKTCSQCAEKVKAAALVCRFCGHRFE